MKGNRKPAAWILLMAACLFLLCACGKAHSGSGHIDARVQIKMEKLVSNPLVGMGALLLVLILLSILMSCFWYSRKWKEKLKEKAQEPVPELLPKGPVPVKKEEDQFVDDLELVAVITAAIAAFTGSSPSDLVVRSIKRAPDSKWKKA